MTLISRKHVHPTTGVHFGFAALLGKHCAVSWGKVKPGHTRHLSAPPHELSTHGPTWADGKQYPGQLASPPTVSHVSVGSSAQDSAALGHGWPTMHLVSLAVLIPLGTQVLEVVEQLSNGFRQGTFAVAQPTPTSAMQVPPASGTLGINNWQLVPAGQLWIMLGAMNPVQIKR